MIPPSDEFLRRLFDVYDDLNARHFDGALPDVALGVGISESILAASATPKDSTLAVLVTDENGHRILFQDILVDSEFVSEAARHLLHEMVHLGLAVGRLIPADHRFGHGPSFIAECNRIGPSLSALTVHECDIDQCCQRPEFWPHSSPPHFDHPPEPGRFWGMLPNRPQNAL